MDNDPNNDSELWRTQIFITMQWPQHWMDDILKPGISVFEKKLSEQRKGKKCSLIWKQFKSLIHKTLCCRHNVVLCLHHNLSANSVWLRVSYSAHITHFLSSLSGSGQQLFVALCSPRSYRLSLSYRDLLTVMSVLGFHILYSSIIKTVSKYN